MQQLDGKIALVTGGSRGLGLGIVRALAAEGAAVWALARDAATALRTIHSNPGASVGQLAWAVNNDSHQELDAHDRIATGSDQSSIERPAASALDAGSHGSTGLQDHHMQRRMS